MPMDDAVPFSFLTTESPNETLTLTEEGSVVSNDATTAIGALILGLVFLLGVPGNGFIIWSILARTRKHSITTLLILHLAFADGCLMALTIFFVVYLAKRSWVFGNVMCKVLFYLCNTNMYASIIIITLMSLYRLVAIVWPQRLGTLTSRKIVQCLLLAMWALVLVMAIPGLIFRRQKPNNFTGEMSRYSCDPDHHKSKQLVFQYTFETVAGFIIPYAVIVFSYVRILRRLKQTKFRRMVHSEKLIMAIVVTFALFWLPYHIINIVQVVGELSMVRMTPTMRTSLAAFTMSCRPITSSLAFISSCANPVLYTFAGKSYIRKNGLSFMARLFEGITLDSGTRKNRQISREVQDLTSKEKEPVSSSSSSGGAAKNKR